MAELNFGLLTPPGSQSIGNAFAQGMDQAAVARAQENQNALAQYTLGKAKREDEVNNRLLSDLRAAKTPEEQMQAYVYAGRAKDALAMQSDILKNTKTRNEILAQPGAQANTQAQTAVRHGTVMKNEATRVLADPTFDNAMRAVVNFGRATGQDVTQELATITAMGNDPVKIANWAKGHAVTGEQLLKQSVVKTIDTDMGGSISRQTYDAQGVAVGAPIILPKTPTPGSVPGIAQADIARARAIDEGIPVPGAAPAQAGTPVTQATFPRDTAVQQTTRMTDATAIKRQELANEQIKLANATQKLASPAAAKDPDIRKFYEDQAKQATNNIASLNQELKNKTNNMPGAAAPVVNNLPTAQPPAVAPTAYSSKMLRDMALKGMQPNGKGGQTPIPGGEADPVVKQQVSTAQAVGAQIGKNNAVALEKLPNAITTGKELIRKLDEILGDANVVDGQIKYKTAPAAGFDSAFGPTGIIARAYPSSEAAGFQARVKEILGGAFLEAYETLRGAQGITDIEGKKATEARTRMGFDLSKTEFITAAREYRKTAAEALARSETRLNSLQRSAAPAGAPSLDVIFNTQRPQ